VSSLPTAAGVINIWLALSGAALVGEKQIIQFGQADFSDNN
jgi:hypothetical protein